MAASHYERHPSVAAQDASGLEDRLHLMWKTEPGFLSGVAGIGLGLLAAVTDLEPAWDRVLLVAIPPRNGASV